MESLHFRCRQCQWEGSSDDVDWENTETCMGSDKAEICPNCGSQKIYISHTRFTNIQIQLLKLPTEKDLN